MKGHVAEKIKLTSLEELLRVPEVAGTRDVEVDAIYPFPNHPFKVVDDEKMEELVESIKKNGILTPVVLRPDDEGTYEMISGHRRLHAAKKVGLTTIPAIVKQMTTDDAVIYMVDSNVQREQILPSEKAFAYKMRLTALKRKAGRPSLQNSGQVGPNKLTTEIIGEICGDSSRQVKRYIRLTELLPELLALVDANHLAFTVAVDISYFDKTIQKWLYEYIQKNCFIKQEQINALKRVEDIEHLTQNQMDDILCGAIAHQNRTRKVTLSEKRLDRYFPAHFSAIKREEIIIELLERWKAENQEV